MAEAHKNIVTLMKRIILDNNIKCWSKVENSDQAEMTIMMMQWYGAEGLEFVVDEEQVNNALIKYMLNPEPCRALDLAAIIERLAIEYHDNHLSMLFDSVLRDIDWDEKCEAGRIPYKDEITGEVKWI